VEKGAKQHQILDSTLPDTGPSPVPSPKGRGVITEIPP